MSTETPTAPTKMMTPAELYLAIQKIPVLDLNWPQEMQDRWMGWFTNLMAQVRATQPTAPATPALSKIRAEIERLDEAATEGPWAITLREPGHSSAFPRNVIGPPGVKFERGKTKTCIASVTQDADADLIAYLRNNIASLLSIADMLEQRLAAVLNAAAPMFEAVDIRRNYNALQERADFLIKRGWTPIPFTPLGAPDGFIAKITHPYQKWQKKGHAELVTERALKMELRHDTDALRSIAQMEEGKA